MSEYKERFCESLPAFIGEWLDGLEMDHPCESPIESLMLAALLIVGSLHHPGEISTEIQREIGDYRVDFLVTRVGYISHKELITIQVVVECDGHDFHEKTKAQASKAKKRDRELQRLGFNVLRFTGSDIWKDPFACAQEVFGFLDEKIFSK